MCVEVPSEVVQPTAPTCANICCWARISAMAASDSGGRTGPVSPRRALQRFQAHQHTHAAAATVQPDASASRQPHHHRHGIAPTPFSAPGRRAPLIGSAPSRAPRISPARARISSRHPAGGARRECLASSRSRSSGSTGPGRGLVSGFTGRPFSEVLRTWPATGAAVSRGHTGIDWPPCWVGCRAPRRSARRLLFP